MDPPPPHHTRRLRADPRSGSEATVTIDADAIYTITSVDDGRREGSSALWLQTLACLERSGAVYRAV